MVGATWTQRASVFAALGVLPGCYSGLDPSRGGGDGADAGDADGDGDGDGEDADGGSDGADDGVVEGQCGEPATGTVALRRLTNDQYRNTVRDLLGVDAGVVDTFVPDERIGAFKSNGVAPLGELQVEDYMDAAEVIATEAAVDLGGLLPCDPGAIGEDACAEEFIRTLGPRAYRRPLGEDEIAALHGVYLAGKAEADFANGVRVALQGMLQSPYFLYHVEEGQPTNGSDGSDGAVVQLTSHDLASRMSYFLWGSMPDAGLFAAAQDGTLDTEEGIEGEVERMLADPKAAEAIANFHVQWLGIDGIDALEKDPGTYANFDTALALAMKAETADFANWVISEQDARLETLLTEAVTLTDDPDLLALYGVAAPAGHVPGEPIALPPTERAGLLTHASLLAEHAHANQSSPVHRGQLIRENFLCTPLPAPPEDVDNVPPDPQPGATTRERLAEHTSNPSCGACHALIDGLGFGLEAYDGVGAFRTLDQGLPVDASGEVIGAGEIDGTYDGGVELAAKLATSEMVRACVATQWFRFSLGRMNQVDDACAVETSKLAFAESDYDIRALIKTIVLSDSFRFRRAPEET